MFTSLHCKKWYKKWWVLSDLPFIISGLVNKNLNPYKLIEAVIYTDWDRAKDKPEISLESEISTEKCGNIWISFDRVDFGFGWGRYYSYSNF